MRNIRLLFLITVLVTSAISLFGCSGSTDKKDEGTIGTTAPINNSDPAAKNAPAAPRDPSIIMPGGPKKGAKMGP